ncbi:MAG: hypothetical protein MUE85_22755 [Microscillaceae bacterium]|jgi:hypothetical protein|nr:hypothetical protein [Microscillaceae bacterium]
MQTTENPKSKAQVKTAFRALLLERQTARALVRTQEEIAQAEKDKALVNITSQYTPDTIVKGLADLQLALGNAVLGLSAQMQAELTKLEELKASIEVEQAHLKELNAIQLTAEALHILRQEQATQLQTIQDEFADKTKQITTESTEKRQLWEKQQQEHNLMVSEYTENLKLEREKELADYKYELERTYKVETDAFAEKRKLLERELRETDRIKQKDWNAREKTLELNQTKLDEYKTKVDGSAQEIEEAAKKAREEAIKNASKEVKIRADLAEKEMDGTKQVFELQVQSLENTLAQQTDQVEKLQSELKEAMSQVQSLSLKAIENTNFKK